MELPRKLKKKRKKELGKNRVEIIITASAEMLSEHGVNSEDVDLNEAFLVNRKKYRLYNQKISCVIVKDKKYSAFLKTNIYNAYCIPDSFFVEK